jgi:multicomponent Na+:H+ antiporter subunit G
MIAQAMVIVLLGLGSALMLLAGVGVVRMPDLFTRMHVATKSATLGVGCVILSVAIYFGDLAVFTRALLVILFFLLTAPVGAHLIGRAGYIVGAPLWEGTKWDELKGKYDLETHTLDSPASLTVRPGERRQTDVIRPSRDDD